MKLLMPSKVFDAIGEGIKEKMHLRLKTKVLGLYLRENKLIKGSST